MSCLYLQYIYPLPYYAATFMYHIVENFDRKIFGGLLKICHLAEFTLVEFTLAVERVLAIMFLPKWLIEHAGNLIGL